MIKLFGDSSECCFWTSMAQGSYTSCNVETQTGFWNFGGHAEQNQFLNQLFLTLHEVLGICWFKLKNWVELFLPYMCRKGEDKNSVFLI